jgi:DNA-binding CsgD family transcriptional regulator
MSNKTGKEAAGEQNISVHTYNTQIKWACKKMGVHSKTLAVKKLSESL